MRKLCPNIDREDGLETVLEVPVPEEMFTSMGSNLQVRLANMLTWMKAQSSDKWSQPIVTGRINELRFLLYLVGSPLIPLQVQLGHSVYKPVKDCSIGLDPRSTANLFIDATCIEEKIISNEDCFILKLETSPAIREAQSGPNYEIIHHTIWGYFSQRSGLLIQFEDSRLLMMKTKDDNDVFWKTRTESATDDCKYIDGVNIAHCGKTSVTVFRYGEQSANHKRQIKEKWKIEDVDFNVWGLSKVHFLPPSNLPKN